MPGVQLALPRRAKRAARLMETPDALQPVGRGGMRLVPRVGRHLAMPAAPRPVTQVARHSVKRGVRRQECQVLRWPDLTGERLRGSRGLWAAVAA
jgi:hypothetical protein